MGASHSIGYVDFPFANYWVGKHRTVTQKALRNQFPDQMVKSVSVEDLQKFATAEEFDADRLLVIYDPQSQETLNVVCR